MKKKTKNNWLLGNYLYLIVGLIAALILFNQYQILTLSSSTGSYKISLKGADTNIKNLDVTKIKSTAQGVAVLYPLSEIKTQEDAISIIIPTGTPEYGQDMGVSFDDPVKALSKMANAYPTLKKQAQENPELWKRYLNLAAQPRGIACEFCCGIGPQGVDSKGELRCGCSHNPALQSLTMWLLMNTEYSDAQVLKEVYKWKSIWFPKDMVGLAIKISGGDEKVLQDLPGMVGGC